jgi:hypothetical protein
LVVPNRDFSTTCLQSHRSGQAIAGSGLCAFVGEEAPQQLG